VIGGLQRRAEEIRAQGGLGEVKVLRTYEPQDRVHARLEVSGSGFLRRPEAGVDVMGDGALVPYRGAIFRKRLDPRSGQSAYDAVHEALKARGQ
jgi:hypothetical protein